VNLHKTLGAERVFHFVFFNQHKTILCKPTLVCNVEKKRNKFSYLARLALKYLKKSFISAGFST